MFVVLLISAPLSQKLEPPANPARFTVLEILNSVAERARAGDILFLTICAEPPAGLNRKSDSERKVVLKSQIPSLKAAISKVANKDFSDRHFPVTSGKLLLKMLQSAFSSRAQDGNFHPQFKVIYRDSMVMCTIGGVFCENFSRQPGKLRKLCEEKLPTFCQKSEFYSIPKFNFTELERILLQKSSFAQNSGYIRRLKGLGIPGSELEEYETISRFVPKYMESIL
ncbi:O-methyltransferase [Sinorhizobium saheli]|uniref:O-methyltransferase n=1 Tax=Sinorhizobium saheli TaxID=36856 RepID=UPI00129738D3|nr:O-methyltransferase [Sinorhizobium saheli]MQW87291.1 hypothetical protein [Sinorhizobium saheli]